MKLLNWIIRKLERYRDHLEDKKFNKQIKRHDSQIPKFSIKSLGCNEADEYYGL